MTLVLGSSTFIAVSGRLRTRLVLYFFFDSIIPSFVIGAGVLVVTTTNQLRQVDFVHFLLHALLLCSLDSLPGDKLKSFSAPCSFCEDQSDHFVRITAHFCLVGC